MSGHSKWANTKHRRIIQNTKRDKIFTKVVRSLVTAARLGGSNISSNSRLRAAVDRALSHNITRKVLNRAISRGMGDNHIKNVETIIYEGYGPDGIAIMVECFSDNRNRTAAKVRYAFNKYNCNLGTKGSVAHLFEKKGVISFRDVDEDIIIEAILEVGADDIAIHDNGIIDVYTVWRKVDMISNALERIGLKAVTITISMIPLIKIKIDMKTAFKLLNLINMLKGYNDVHDVYHNGEISGKVVSTTNYVEI